MDVRPAQSSSPGSSTPTVAWHGWCSNREASVDLDLDTDTDTGPGDATKRGVRPQAWVDVLDMLAASDEQLIERHGRWYLHQRNPVWLRRNALIVLGNTGQASDSRVAATLRRYLDDPDPMLREHAEWAARQLGLVTA
jgi:hypothetical protein